MSVESDRFNKLIDDQTKIQVVALDALANISYGTNSIKPEMDWSTETNLGLNGMNSVSVKTLGSVRSIWHYVYVSLL